MAYPASTEILSRVLDRIAGIMLIIKGAAQRLRTESAAGPINRQRVVIFSVDLANNRDQISALAATTGLAAYARSEYNNAGLDIAAEYAATVAQIDACKTWIAANYPKDAGTGAIFMETFDANGRTQPLTFTTAQLAGLRTQLDSLIATIA